MDISKLSGRRVLVTGGAGFIGSNLVEFLINNDISTVCLDNLSTGKIENIQSLRKHKNFELIEGDIRDYDVCLNSCKNIEIVFHQAALGSVPRSINDPVKTNNVNIGGFVNMIFAAHQSGVRRFVYAASSSTYGDDPRLPKLEENIGKPLSPYAITKYANELYADVFAKLYGFDVIGLRYFNVFGRKQDSESGYAAVIPKFIKALLFDKAPVINGDGTHSRDFTYIDNVVDANILAAVTENPAAINQVYNIAFGDNTNLTQLFMLIQHHLAKFKPEVESIRPIYGPERKGDVKHSLASIDKAKKLLGYEPKYDIDKGLEEAIEWYYKEFSN